MSARTPRPARATTQYVSMCLTPKSRGWRRALLDRNRINVELVGLTSRPGLGHVSERGFRFRERQDGGRQRGSALHRRAIIRAVGSRWLGGGAQHGIDAPLERAQHLAELLGAAVVGVAQRGGRQDG